MVATLFGTLALAVAETTLAQAKYHLRWGHYIADGAFAQIEKDFASEIEKRTNGRVKIDIAFAGGLGQGSELLNLAAKGAVDMAASAPGYNPDQLPYWRAFQLPLLFATSKQAMIVLGKVVEEFPVYRQEMDRNGVVWLFQQPLGEYFMSGLSPDCINVDKLRGKKIRSFGADIPKAFTAIGAVPVTVAPTGVYEALQRGTIDYSILNAGSIFESYRVYEITKYHCGPALAFTGHNIVISKRTWARLPADVQKIFLDLARKTQHDYLAWVDKFERDAVNAIKAKGGIFTELPAAEFKKWKAKAPDFLAQWEKDTAAATKDSETPRKVAARWRQLLAQ